MQAHEASSVGAEGRLVSPRHAFPRQPGRGVAGLLSPAFSFEPQLRRSALSPAVRAVRSLGAGSACSRQLSCVSGSPPSTAALPGVPGEAALGCSASESFLFFPEFFPTLSVSAASLSGSASGPALDGCYL